MEKKREETERYREEQFTTKGKMDTQQGTVNTLVRQFNSKHPDEKIYDFSVEMAAIAPKLAKENDKLHEREAFVNQEKARNNKELANIREAETELDRFEEGYHFKSSTVTSVLFSEEEITNFTYKRIEHIHEATTDLRSAKKKVDEGTEEISQAKRRFRDFCNRTITDSKLKNMAIQGVEYKETYDDILEFRQNMMTSVERADRYARDYISENDK